MSSRRSSKVGKVAYMEEADEDDHVIEGTEQYAASQASSPTKERMNTKKTRRGESGSPGNGLTDSDSTVHPRRDARLRAREKEKEEKKPSSGKKVTMAARPSTRPSAKHSKTTPIIQSANPNRRSRDDASFYAADSTTVTPSSSIRQRAYTGAPRPASYYGPSRPPLSNQKYYTQPAPTALLPTSYPPQPWYPPVPAAHHYPNDYPADYFPPQQQQHLLARFNLNRPASALAHRPYAVDKYERTEKPVRRLSLTRPTRNEEDRARMPPPPRPSTTRPLSTRASPFAPPPPSQRYEDEAFEGDGTYYRDVSREVSPLDPIDYAVARQPRPRRPSVGTTSIVYDVGHYSTEVAGRSSRRNSYFGEQSTTPSVDDKLRQAASYQDQVSGGPTMPLTAETLRKASKRGQASSRSTRSSASRDESDWRQSATTRTTRSSNEEDVTIKVKGSTVLKYGGAEMQCKDGAEINISARGPQGTRGSSDKSSYAGGDDRRTRFERPAQRARATSQAASYSRTAAPGGYNYYAPDYARAAPLVYPPNWV